MTNDRVDYDQLCVKRCSIAEVLKDLDGILIGPVVQNEAQKKDISGFMKLRLRVKETLAVELDLILLDGNW